MLYSTVITKRELNHDGWIMIKRIRSWIQAAEIGFLRRMAGISAGNKVRSLDVCEELGVELVTVWVHVSWLK